MNTETKIVCPHCGQDIDVNQAITHQLELEISRKYTAEMADEKKKISEQQIQLEALRSSLLDEKTKQEEFIADEVKTRLTMEKATLQQEAKTKAEQELADGMEILKKELEAKTDQVKGLNKAMAEVERLKREKDELKDSLEAENERKLNESLQKAKEVIKSQEKQRHEFEIAELVKKLEDQRSLTEEMIRKQEQGSMQLQGEVQELGIESWLSSSFPLDTITEIKKGERGADCLQYVHTHSRQDCGIIYYESKRTKEFKNAWIEKFKNDIREKGADVGVLVTEVYPKGMERLGMIDGIWVCSYEEFKGLSSVLREGVIQVSAAAVAQENKGEKMVMLYDYLSGNEFRRQVEAIVEGFTQMQQDLISEKRSIMGHWKKREKQIQKVLLNTSHMHNAIRGIAGAAIQPIKTLELSEDLEYSTDDSE